MGHTFYLKTSQGAINSYWGEDNVDEESPFFDILDYGNDLIDKFKAYYELSYRKTIPRPHLFIINNTAVNAFAVYEETLGEYCIGIFAGVIQKICEKAEEIVNMVIDKSAVVPKEDRLIPEERRDLWVKRVIIDAQRFFVAHEFAHILCGHVKRETENYFEFLDGDLSEEENLYQQMKEFDADETAMSILCYMNRCSWESAYRRESARLGTAFENQRRMLKEAGLPERLINAALEKFSEQFRQADDRKMDCIRGDLKYLMLGVNIVFLTLDEKRTANLNHLADRFLIPQEDRNSFYFKSGLQLIRCIDHPIPAIRLDAVIRIMDEYIENMETKENADKICEEVSEYVWDVEYLRCNGNKNMLYNMIAYTPTAQNFIQEMELLWQREKNTFSPYMDQLERLFYVNTIIHMTDEGDFA